MIFYPQSRPFKKAKGLRNHQKFAKPGNGPWCEAKPKTPMASANDPADRWSVGRKRGMGMASGHVFFFFWGGGYPKRDTISFVDLYIYIAILSGYLFESKRSQMLPIQLFFKIDCHNGPLTF